MSTNPIRHSYPVYPRLPFREYFSRDLCLSVMAHQAWVWSQLSIGTPCLGTGPLSTRAVGWRDVVFSGYVSICVEETWVYSAIYPYTHTVSTSKWQSNRLTTYGVPSVKHELDMETTCICIHVTAGSMSPSQPNAITERLLFSFCVS